MEYPLSNIRNWLPILEAETAKAQEQPPEEDTPPAAAFNLQDMIDVGIRYSGGDYRHGKRKWSDLSDPEKIQACTYQSGKHQHSKQINGHVKRQPIYCNICERCRQANALKLQEKVEMLAGKVEVDLPAGQWRKKTVDDTTEAQSLKKHISRNQKGRYFEVAASESKNEVYTYVVDEPGKDMDSVYGEVVDLAEVDYREVYETNRSTGKKLSTGKAFRGVSNKPKEDTIRIAIPQIIIQDRNREDEAEQIMHRTNYLERAETAEDVKKLYAFQLKFIIRHLEAAGIRIAAIETRFYNYERAQIIDDWNRNVNHWLSINASLPEKKEANMDSLTKYLVHKVGSKPEQLLS